MNQKVQAEVAALRGMSPAQLRDKYLEVFGEPTRTGNREFLYKRLAWRIQSQAEGTLSERARQRAAELARDADIRMTMPRTPTATLGATSRVASATIGSGKPPTQRLSSGSCSSPEGWTRLRERSKKS